MDKKWMIARLDFFRKEKGWSKCKLNEESGFSAGMIYQWYNTDRMPTIQNLDAMCGALGISLGDFFSNSDTKLNDIKLKKIQDFLVTLNENELDVAINIISELKKLRMKE